MTFPTILSPGRIIAATVCHLRLLESQAWRHVVLMGATGGGKTKLIELICRQLSSQGAGYTYVDPHGDGVDAVAQWLAMQPWADPTRIHYLRPGLDTCFSLDPYAGCPSGESPMKLKSWLETTVDRIIRALLRGYAAGDMEIMKRLQFNLSTFLFAAGVPYEGRRLGLGNVHVLTNPERPEFDEFLTKAGPTLLKLHPDIYYELKRIKDMGEYTRNKVLESTINCLSPLKTVSRQVFGGHAPSHNLRKVILNRETQLVNLRVGDHLSRGEGNLIGGTLIYFLLTEAMRLADELPEERRVPHYLIIDEAETYLGEDLRLAMGQSRKFKTPCILSIQVTKNLVKGDLDLRDETIGNAGIQMAFALQGKDDLEYMGPLFGYGSLDLRPLLRDIVLPDGYDWVETQSVGMSAGSSRTASLSRSATQTQSQTEQQHTAESIQRQMSLALSESESEGSGWGTSESQSLGRSTGTSQQESVGSSHGITLGTSKGRSESRSVGETQGQSEGCATGQSLSESQSQGTSVSRSRSAGYTHGRSDTVSQSDTRGKSVGSSHGVSHQDSHSDSESSSKQSSLSASSGTSRQSSEGHSTNGNRSEGTALSSSGNTVHSANGSMGTGESSSRSNGDSSSQTLSESKNEAHASSNSSSNGTTDTTSQSASKSSTDGRSVGQNESWSQGTTDGRSDSRGSSVSRGESESRSVGTSESRSISSATGETSGTNTGVSASKTAGKSHGGSQSISTGTANGESRSQSTSTSTGITAGVSLGQGLSSGSSRGKSVGHSTGETAGIARGETDGLSITFQKTPLARNKIIDDQPTGSLIVSVQDQLAAVMNRLASLPDRYALVRVRGMGRPFLMCVHDVADPYGARAALLSRAWKDDDLRLFIARIHAAHACYFSPREIERLVLAAAPLPALTQEAVSEDVYGN